MITCHSEYGTIRSIWLKPAKDAFNSQETLSRQWQALNYLAKPEFEQALTEYQAFRAHFDAAAMDVRLFEPNKSVQIDSIYCRDAAIATDYGMIICNMGKGARLNEPQVQKEAYLAQNQRVLGHINGLGTLEGGDVAWLDEKTLAVGHTYRTNLNGISQLKALLEPKGIEVITVDLPHYKGPSDVFHLMSILSPVDKNLAVVYSPLMPISFRKELIQRGFQFVEVPEEEFESMGCNVLALAPRKCLMVAGNPVTESRLMATGCEVVTYTGQEISVKGGGGPTCLTRPIDREI